MYSQPEMALRRFRAFAARVVTRGERIGMHLHAWNSPPDVPLTSDDARLSMY